MAQTNLGVSVAVGLAGSRARLNTETDAVRSGAPIGRLVFASRNEKRNRFEPQVSSPVVLAIRPQLKGALAQQNWGTLPGLQSNPNSLNGMNLPGWGSLRLALPLNGDSDASYLAAEAVAAASAPAGAPPSAGTSAVNTLMSGQPKLADNKATTAMDALLNATDPAAAPVHAVVTTEQQLYQRGASLSDAKNVVGEYFSLTCTHCRYCSTSR